MNVLKYRVSLDMFDTHSQTTIKAKKGDSACQIHITLTEKGKIYKIGEGCHATFNAKKSDGNFIYDNCTIEDNTIVYDFTSSIDENGNAQISACEGIVECEVTLYNATGEQLTSPRFTLVIDGTVYNGEEIISTPEANVFKKLIAEAEDVLEEIKENSGTIEGKEDKVNKAEDLLVSAEYLGGKYPSAVAVQKYVSTYVEGEKTLIDAAINKKADKTDLAKMENTDNKITEITDPHDMSAEEYPTANAVFSFVVNQTAPIGEQVWNLRNQIESKADKTDLNGKADRTELDTKADKSQVGDIETALDNIISIQNSLIGGGSV